MVEGEPLERSDSLTRPLMTRQVPTSYRQAAKLALFRGKYRSLKAPCVFALRMSGAVEVKLLRSSMTWVARRHTALRTYFPDHNSLGTAICLPPADINWPLECIDLRGMTPETTTEAESYALRELQQPFNPGESPLYRGILIRYTDHWILGIAISHTVFDGESVKVFLKDLEHVYQHLLSGNSASDLLRDVSDFSKFAASERSWMRSQDSERAVHYWASIWKGMGPFPAVPFAIASSKAGAPSAGIWSRILSAPAIDRQRAAYPDGHLSLFALAAACTLSALREVTGESDLGLLYNNSRRYVPGANSIIGFLNNRQLLRIDAGPADAVTIMSRTRIAVLDSLEYSMAPFEFLIEKLTPEFANRPPDSAHIDLNVDREDAPPCLPRVRTELAWPVEPSAFAGLSYISINLSELQNSKGVSLSAGYSTELYEEAFVVRFMERVAQLLENNPGT